MLYSRKIVLALTVCVTLASAAQRKSAEQEALDRAQVTFDNAPDGKDKETAKDELALAKADLSYADAKRAFEDLKSKTPNDAGLPQLELVFKLEDARYNDLAARQNLASAQAAAPKGNHSSDVQKAKTAAAALVVAKANHGLPGWKKLVDQATASIATAKLAETAEKDAKKKAVLTAQVKVDEAQKTVFDAEVAKADAESKSTDAAVLTQALASANDKLTTAKAELADAKTEAAKPDVGFFKSIGNFLWRPVTNYKLATSEPPLMDKTTKKPVWEKNDDNKATVLQGLWYALCPSSMGGYAAATTVVAGLAAAGYGGTRMYKNHTEKKRASARNTKWAVAAGLLTAAGAAAGGKYYYDNHYNANQQGEYMGEEVDGDAETSQKADGSSNSNKPAGSKKKNGKKSKKSGTHWMVWAAVIVVALAVIGGAVYYFLFMAEEGSEEDGDAVPEGMDQV